VSLRVLAIVALIVGANLPLQVASTATTAASGPTIAAIAAGGIHTCALTSGGGVKCWGYNYLGQLGDGTTSTRLLPVEVSGLASGVMAIDAGSRHTCALTLAGGVKCWGLDNSEQLNGKRTSRLVPVDIVGLGSGISAVAAGGDYTCALTSGGGVKCWGVNNYSGQLGNGTTTESLVPVDVSGLGSGISAIAAGMYHTCALTTGGGVKCWGENGRGELGNGTTTNSSTPVDVSGLASGVSAIAAGGQHTCALASDGRVNCWGNTLGETGIDSTPDSIVPIDVAGLQGEVSAIAAGYLHTCAVTSRGGIACWGSNSWGQLGSPPGNSRTPIDVLGLASGAIAITAGSEHTCALTSLGRVKCWGSNSFGQFGNGTRTSGHAPVDAGFTIRPAIVLRSSEPAGTIGRGTAITFSATVGPLDTAGATATVRFVIYRLDGDVWRTAASRDVAADANGRATLRWGFATPGSRYVRAKVLSDTIHAGSAWSPPVRYTVR
jgi:hypothetical protein